MAGVNVGGVNIQFGVDLSVLEEGVKEAQSIVSGIKDAFKHITLEAAIKGDPFSEMKKYSNKANAILNDVFNSFANTVEEANRKSIASLTSLEKEFYKLGQAARKNAETVAKEYQNMIESSETLSNLTPTNIRPIEKFASKDIRSAESRKKFRMELFPADEVNKGLVKTLESFKGYGDELDAIIDRITGKLKSFVPQDFATAQTPKYLKEMKSDFNDLYVGLNKVRTEIEKAGGGSMDEFPKKLKEAFDTSKKLAIEQKRLSEIRAAALEEERKKVVYTTKLAEAKDEEETLKKRRDLLRELTIAEAQYRSNIAAGIEVEKNREALIKSLERKKDVLGGKLGAADQSSLEAAIKLQKESLLLSEQRARMDKMAVAASPENVYQRITSDVEKYILREKELLSEIERGYNVTQNNIELSKLYQTMQARGITLLESQSRKIEEVITKEKVLEAFRASEKTREKFDKSASYEEALERRKQAMDKLFETERMMAANIKANYDVDESRKSQLKALQELEKMGAPLLKEKIELLRQLERRYKDEAEAIKLVNLVAKEYQRFINLSSKIHGETSQESALAKRSALVRDLKTEERSLINIINAGVSTQETYDRLEKVGNDLLAYKIPLLKETSTYMKEVTEARQRDAEYMEKQANLVKLESRSQEKVNKLLAEITATNNLSNAVDILTKKIRDLYTQEKLARDKIAIGFNVEESRKEALKVYSELERMNVPLMPDQRIAQKEYQIKESENLREAKRIEAMRIKEAYDKETEASKSLDVAFNRLIETERKMTLDENRYRAAIEASIDVIKNKELLLSSLQRRSELMKLSPEEAREKRALETEKYVNAMREEADIGKKVDEVYAAMEKRQRSLEMQAESLLAVIKDGIKVDENRIRLSKVFNDMEKDAIGVRNKYITLERENAEAIQATNRAKNLQKAFDARSDIKYQEKLAEAHRKLRLEIDELQTAIRNKDNVEKNTVELRNKLLELSARAATLSDHERMALELATKAIEDRNKKAVATPKVDSAEARFQEKRNALLQEEKRLREDLAIATTAEARRSIRSNILSNLKQQLEAGVQLAPKLNKEMKMLTKEFNKPTGADEFMSKEWFQRRAKWFIELRGLWFMYRQAQDAIAGGFQFEQEMANVRAVAQMSNDTFEKLRDTAIEVGRTTRFSAKEAAEGMVVLAQAGLSAKEILVSIKDVAQLSTATMFDFKGTAELVTTVMRAWNYEASDSKEIVDTLATSINASRLTMEGLVTAMNYVSGVASEVNLSLKDTTGILGTLSNRGLNASIAATSLRAVLGELLRPTDRFRRVLESTGVSLDDINPAMYNVYEIMQKLRDAGWTAEHAFKAFERRAANGAAIMIRNSTAMKDMANRMHELDRAAEMASINLDTVSGQVKQFKDNLVASSAELFRSSEGLLKGVLGAFKLFSVGIINFIDFYISKPIGAVYKYLRDFEDKMHHIDSNYYRRMRNAIQTLKEQEANIVNVVDKYRQLSDSLNDIVKLLKEYDSKTSDEKEKLSILKKSIDIAKQAKLATEDEIKDISVLTSEQEKRIGIEKLVNDKYKERKELMIDELAAILQIQDQTRKVAIADTVKQIENDVRELNKLRSLDEARTRFSISPKKERSVTEEFIQPSWSIELGYDLGTQVAKILRGILNDEQFKELIKESEPEIAERYIKEETERIKKDIIEKFKSFGALSQNDINILKDLKIWDSIEEIVNEKVSEVFEEPVPAKYRKKAEEMLMGAFKKAETSKELPTLPARKKVKELEKERISSEIKVLENKKDLLEKTREEVATIEEQQEIYEKILGITNKIKKKKKESASIDEEIQKLSLEIAHEPHKTKPTEEETEILRIKTDQLKIDAELAAKETDKATKAALIAGIQEVLRNEAEKQLIILDEQQNVLERIGISERDIYNLDLQRNMIGLKELLTLQELHRESKGMLLSDKQYLELQNNINKKYIERQTLVFKYNSLVRNMLEQGAKKELDIMNERKAIAEIDIKSNRFMLQLKQEEVDIELALIKNKLLTVMSKEERNALESEYNAKLVEQLKLNEEIARYDNLRYDVWKHILEKNKEFENILHIIGKQVVDELHTGLSTILQDLTGGFQEQHQEAENLKGEVAELRQESDELLSKGLLSEDEAKRFKEITNEINRLNREINKLENPINNTLEAMKKFAKEMVDSIREVINKWIAMKIVMGMRKLVNPKLKLGEGDSSWVGFLTEANGGVIPSIKSFKKFSSGGMTSNPTMAILGDNPSGKELVIPSENIANNNVSGYVRGQEQPITIVNVVTPEDIASAMAGKAGERVILNAIGKDMRNRGMTTRTVKV